MGKHSPDSPWTIHTAAQFASPLEAASSIPCWCLLPCLTRVTSKRLLVSGMGWDAGSGVEPASWSCSEVFLAKWDGGRGEGLWGDYLHLVQVWGPEWLTLWMLCMGLHGHLGFGSSADWTEWGLTEILLQGSDWSTENHPGCMVI